MDEQRLFNLFTDLCLFDAPALAERNVVDWTKALLADIGLEVWEDGAAETLGGNANNLIAKLNGSLPGAPSIFLSAHFDTVEPTAGLEIGEENGIFFSKSDTILGADDKAGMAPAIEAVRSIMETDQPHGDVFLVFSVAEEIGLRGAFALDIQSLGVDYGFVFDTGPPVGSFVNHVGTHDNLDVKIIGVPAHAGKHPEEGVNAIQAAGKALARMKIGRVDEVTTSNVGYISGGTATNVVPAEAVLHCEARSLDEARLDTQIAHMKECFETEAEAMGAKAEIDYRRAYRGYEVAPSSSPVMVAQAAARKMGLSGDLRWTLGGSDANAYNAKGIPTIVCGTGMEKIHTHDEFVSKKDLVDLTLLAINIVREAAQ
ncbi:MAG TPA: M20/M25/M40 family metallo-hydrolase [Fimbriimonadales bacterium]|jgi:tripeptide aminopeptidase|nr:M20/M25/M40 family metallo-hydrolase [Fimbriimonadales bacterium]